MRRLVAAFVLLIPMTLAAQPSSRGDANADSAVNTTDVTYLAQNLFGAGPAPVRNCLGDVNADAAVSPADIFRLIDFVAGGGAAPPPQPDEICDENDNDCDGDVDETFDLFSDVENCGSCGLECSGLNATRQCTLGQCDPICNSGYQSCDGNLMNGCEALRNTNPNCSTMLTRLASVSGDEGDGTSVTTRNGYSEEFLVINFTENVTPAEALTGTITLTSPAGVNFDLTVRCFSCGGALFRTSSSIGSIDSVHVSRTDEIANNNFDVVIEIRYISGERSACSNWMLEVKGDVAVVAPLMCN